MRRLSSLTGLSVIASSEGMELGTVSEVVVDLAEGSVEGLIVRSGSVDKGVRAGEIDVFGADAIMVDTSNAAQPLAEVPELADRRRGKDEKPLKVMTSSGQKLGMVGEVFIDPKAKTVTRFEISGGPLRDITDGTLSFPVVEGMTHGRDILLVPDEVIASIKTGEGGLKGAWAKLSEQLKEEYETASERAEVLYEKSAKNVQRAVKQAQEKSREVSEQVSKRIDKVKEEKSKGAKDETSDVAELEQEQVEETSDPDVVLQDAAEAREADAPTPEPPPDEAGTSEETVTIDTGVEELEEEQVETEPSPEPEVAEGSKKIEEGTDEEE